MSLKQYKKKRDFAKTREPALSKISEGKGHHFVIQKHDASRLHYDFRLEIGGALASWAVPKGIPLARGERRLAVHVEDHPISYMKFEGTIPKGQYGGGTVMVWDIGTFEPLDGADVTSGKLHFILKGKKLNGEWRLVRMHGSEQWLLIRGGEDMGEISQKLDDTSAISGRSMKEIAGEIEGDVWQSGKRVKAGASAKSKSAKAVKAVKTVKAVEFIDPMKARLVESPPTGEWIYEIKFDGFRALAFKNGKDVRLFSRNEKDFGEKFSEIRDGVAEMAVEEAVIDGEIVALDSAGRSSFQLLQGFELGEGRPPLFFYAFDLLRLDGRDLTREPLLERKSQLEKILKGAPKIIRYSSSLGKNAKALLPKVRKLGLEGLIGKRADSVYEAGRRSGAWIKLKIHQEQEMVIGGYTDPEGSRAHFGSLVIGFYEGKKLIFAGKVGTGFTEAILSSLYSKFKKIAVEVCPFENLPEKRAGRYGWNLTASEMKRCHWIKPELVCQVKFSEWTNDDKLRQPVYLGLREDKDAGEVVREKAAKT